jgi:hypothetical protein
MVEIAPVKVGYSDGQRKVSTASWLGNQTRDMYERPRQRSRAEFSAICDKGSGLSVLNDNTLVYAASCFPEPCSFKL